MYEFLLLKYSSYNCLQTLDDLQAIQLQVTSTAADLHLDNQPSTASAQQATTSSRHTALRPRQLAHKPPDAAATSRFMADLPAEPVGEGEGNQQIAVAAVTETTPAPRMIADPAHVHQQLAGWTRVIAAGEAGDAAAGEDEGVQDVEDLGGSIEDVDDIMDEEEWV